MASKSIIVWQLPPLTETATGVPDCAGIEGGAKFVPFPMFPRILQQGDLLDWCNHKM